MKKIIIPILIILAVLVVGFFILRGRESNNISSTGISDQLLSDSYDSRSCYEYTHAATTNEPYTNYELVDVTREGDAITGTKKGTQSGPDMNNGYEGSITGTINNDMINVIFSYVIEGSSQKEKEIYRVGEDSLTKLRYVLVEESGVLVPDLSSSLKELVYKKVACQSDEIVTNNNDWIFFSSPTSEFTFFYPKDLGTKYIHTAEWPPVLTSVNDPYVCREGGSEVLQNGKTTEVSVGENDYCMNVSTEGAAGSIYTSYSYVSRIDPENSARMDFSVRIVQCANYDDPQKSECLAERESFDINKTVDQMFVSVSKSEK